MKMPIISVVMPVCHVEKYMRTAVDSVLQQTCQYFELICVHDGNSGDVLRMLASYDDQRIRVINQANPGLAAAINTGIHSARGEFIAFLDANDCYEPEKLLLHLKHLLSNPEIGVSYCPSLFIDEEGNQTGLGQYPQLQNINLKQVMCRNPVGNRSAAVIRRATLESMQPYTQKNEFGHYCYFDESLQQSEQNDLWMRISLNTDWRFEGIEMPLTFYRVDRELLSTDLGEQFSYWQRSMERHLLNHPHKVKPWLSLAKAYQLRYLARRAVKCGNPFTAIGYVFHAITTNIRILWEEPVKTFVTVATAFLGLLPETLYQRLERMAIRRISKRSISV